MRPKLVLEYPTGQGVAHQDRWDAQSARILLNESLERINTALAAARRPVVTALEENVVNGSAATKVLAERIKLFQEIVMASPKPDGRIDPGAATEIALLAGLPAGFTENKLRLIIPEAPLAKVKAYQSPLDELMDAYNIDTPLRQAHFIAQVAVESDRLRTAREYASGDEYEGREDLGNTEDGDGPRFKGRGLIQLTGRSNYKAYGDDSDLSLTGPDDEENRRRLETEPDTAVDVSCWFWQTHGLNKWADADNGVNVSKIVNAGGIGANTTAVHNLGERLTYLRRAKAVLIPPRPSDGISK